MFRISFWLISLFFMFAIYAQENSTSEMKMKNALVKNQSVYPVPQKIIGDVNKLARITTSVNADGTTLSAFTKTLLAELLKINESETLENKDNNSATLIKKILLSIRGANTENDADCAEISGAYTFKIRDENLIIFAHDERGLFYALQTLRQLLAHHNFSGYFPTVEIHDFPLIKFRGVVEGFYGNPWSHTARKSFFEFAGRWKMNTYIYGPKDDPYHGFSTQWREPYPAEKAAEITDLIQTAAANFVDFVWAVHPGRDIKWDTDADIIACIKKFEMMYDLGVRAFAVFFDDIGGEGARAEKQVELMNRVYHEFVAKKPDIAQLIICPTEYCRGWSTDEKREKYLRTLGENLHPAIEIMWTGNAVCANIDDATMDYINPLIKRAAYIWWNFPVNDYARSNLAMGAAYGNTIGAAEKMRALVANPMEHAEASKIALFGVADYAWNPRAFNADISWARAMHEVCPDAAEALMTFCEHATDFGKNGHSFRRLEESAKMKTLIEEYKKHARNNAKRVALNTEFAQIKNAAKKIKTSSNVALVKEISPWLDLAILIGEAGETLMSHSISLVLDLPDLRQKIYENYLATKNAIDKVPQVQLGEVDKRKISIKYGTLVLMPFIEAMEQFMAKSDGDKSASSSAKITPPKIISDIAGIAALPIQAEKNFFKITPQFEVRTLAKDQVIGLAFAEAVTLSSIHVDFDNDKIDEWATIETSIDGNNWETVTANRKDQTLLSAPLKLNVMPVKFVRVRNAVTTAENIKLNHFAVMLKENE